MSLGIILILGGLVIVGGLYWWTRQRQQIGHIPNLDQNAVMNLPHASNDDAVIVSREHGQLVYVNDRARDWLGMNGGDPNLEHIAGMAEPSDSFLELFAGAGQASFQLGRRWVEASSHTIPTGAETRTVIVMRELTAGTTSPEALDLSLAMRTINEIGETVNASMGEQQVLQALLTIVMKAIPAHAGEICLWDENSQTLHPQGWVGDSTYLLTLSEHGGKYQVGEGITGWIAQHHKPVLVASVFEPATVQPKLQSGYKSFVGVPLMLGSRFIGTFELSHNQPDRFSQADMALLQAVSKPVSVAIYNAELYSQQARRINDMASLQEITRHEEMMTDTRAVYKTLNERLAALVSANICGILVYDEQRQALVPELPYHGLADNVMQNTVTTIALPLDSPQRDIWENQPYWVTNDASDEPLIEALGLKALFNLAGIKNTALIPLEIGSERIGMVQIANKQSPGGFTSQDIKDMRMLAAQAAIVVENVRLFQREQRRDTEMTSLQEMSQAIGMLAQEGEFYSDVTARIARLMNIELCGILIHDEGQERLVSQPPFFGATDAQVADYSIDMRPGSPFESAWSEIDVWFSNHAQTEALIYAAGLEDSIQRLGIQKMMMASMSVGGRRIGMLQVANKRGGQDFNDKDAQLLLIFASQAAAMIENARLVQDVQRSARQANQLRNIAELAGAILTPEDSFTPLLSEIAALTGSPLVFINVLDPQTGSLITYPRWTHGAELAEPVVFDVYSQGFQYSVAMSHEPFLSNNVLTDKRVLPGYLDMAEKSGISRAVLVPLVVGDRSLGELGIGNRADQPYAEEDVQLLTAIAAQIGATIERLRLYEAAGENLSRRVQELDAISQISSELTQTLDLAPVLNMIRRQAARATRADGSTVVLFTPSSTWASPHIPEVRERLGEDDTLIGLAGIEAEAVLRGSESVTITEYETSGILASPLGARSAIAVAFYFENEVVGVLHLYHKRPNHFDERAASFLLTLAAKASLGYGNYERYREQLDRSSRLRRRVEQLNQIFELGQMLQSNVDQVTMLEAILYSIQQSVGYDAGVVLLVDDDAGVLRRVAQVGLPLDTFETSKANMLPVDDLKSLYQDTYQISESYFYPVERVAEWNTTDLSALSTDFPGSRPLEDTVDIKGWHHGDMLLVPLNGPGGSPLGVISLNRPQDSLRPDRATLEVLEIFAHQAAATIENIRLYLESLQNAEQEARLNAMMETISGTLNTDQIIEAVAYSALRLVPFTQMTFALHDVQKRALDLIRVDLQPDSSLILTKDRQPYDKQFVLVRSIEVGQDHLYYAGAPEAADYNDLRAWQAAGERTSLVIPLFAGGEIVGAIHLGSDLEQAYGFNEFRPLLKRLANLAAVAIQNARLFNEALNLQAYNESVVESIQQGIIVLDKSGLIQSVNEYMIQKYDWDEDQAVGQDLFAYRPQLMDFKLADDVKEALNKGRPHERIGQTTYREDGRMLVRNFYTYPLKSGDNIRGAVILVEDVTERHILERDLEKRANQLSVLTEVSSRITASLNRQEVIKLALDEIGRIIQYDCMTLWSRNGEMLHLEGSSGQDEELERLTADRAHINYSTHERLSTVIDTQQPVAINHLLGLDPLPGEEGAKSWLGVPLVNQGNVVGMIALSKTEEHFYDPQIAQAAVAFANQVAIALANAGLYTEAQYRTERLSLLNRVSVSLAQSLDSENILEIALREIVQTLRIEDARALVFDRDLNIGRVIVVYPRGDEPPTEVIDLNHSPAYQYLRRTASPIIFEDVNALEEDEIRHELVGRGIQAYVLIPMTVGGQVIGAFEVEVMDEPRIFGTDQIDLGLIIANQAAIAVQNTNLLETTLLRTRELETLLEAAQATSLTLDLNEAYRSVADLILHALDMDNCAVMIWDNVENVVEVQLETAKFGDENTLANGVKYDLKRYPAKLRALEEREIIVIRASQTDANPAELEEIRQRGDSVRVLIPLVVREQSIGLIQTGLQTPHRSFGHREIRLAQALGSQAAIAIQNARLSSETAALVEEGFLINNLSQAISSTLTIEDMVMIVRDQVPRVTEAEEMYLALYDSSTQEITFPMAVRRGEDFEIPPRVLNTDEVSFVIKHRRSLSLGGGNWTSDDMRRNLSIANGEGEAKSYLGVPVASGDQVLGVLALRDMQYARAFGINDERLLTTVGTQLGAAIQNARLYQQVRNFADELNQAVKDRTLELQIERDRIDTLYRITSELARTLDMDRVLKRALEMVASAVLADDGVIMLIDPLSDSLTTRAALGTQENMPQEHPAMAMASWVLQHARVVMVDDLRKEEYWDENVPGAAEYRSALAVLLETGDDPQGVMVLLSKHVNVFTEPQLKLVNAAANQVASAINNADLYHLIRDQAERLGKLLRQEQEEAEKNSAIVEGIADGVMLADSEGTIIQFNSAAERILDLPRESVVGQSLFKLTGLFGGSASQWAQSVEGWTHNPESHPVGTFLAETLDLGQKVVRVHLSPVHINERFLGTVSVFRDISTEVEVDRIKSEFVSNVSHELRTPMTSIKGFADLLLMGVAGQMTDPQRTFLTKIKSNAERLSQLVDDLLNISKIDAGEKLTFELVDLTELIPNVISHLESRVEHEGKELNVVVDLEPLLPPIQGDPHKITQVVTNIVDNAFNYTYAGGSITVTAHQDEEKRRVLISVADTGIGIPEEFRSRIWGRFERFDDHALVMDVPGTGLGLSIVKELVQMHNGNIWFESELGQGTTFFVELPIEQPVEVTS